MIYSFLTGALLLITRVDFIRVGASITNISVLPNIIGFGLFSGALAYICYTTGVKNGVELSIAGVIASIELVFAQIIGWTIMGESFNYIKIIGIILMMVSALVALKSAESSTNEENSIDEYDMSKVIEV